MRPGPKRREEVVKRIAEERVDVIRRRRGLDRRARRELLEHDRDEDRQRGEDERAAEAHEVEEIRAPLLPFEVGAQRGPPEPDGAEHERRLRSRQQVEPRRDAEQRACPAPSPSQE